MDWKTAEGKDVANQDLWKALAETSAKRGNKNIEWLYVPAHSGIPANERVDAIAVAFSKSQTIPLYQGSLDAYSVSLEVSEAATVKIKPFYLSLVEGVLKKHATWAECEARVKGIKNTKFKKVSSSQEEEATLKSWGVK